MCAAIAAILAFLATSAGIAGYIYLFMIHGPVVILATLAALMVILIVLAPVAVALKIYAWFKGP